MTDSASKEMISGQVVGEDATEGEDSCTGRLSIQDLGEGLQCVTLLYWWDEEW